MRRAGLIAALLALAGCERADVGADGYAFEQADFTRTDMRLEVVLHPDLRSLHRQMPPGHNEPGREVMAWSRVYLSEPRCEVHIIDPAHAWRPEWLGHELAHCIHGRWHD